MLLPTCRALVLTLFAAAHPSPPTNPNPCRYADDWITKVYSGYSHPPLMVKRADLPVVHTLSPTRYNVSVPANIQTILLREVAKGKQAIKAFALKHYRVSPMH